MNSSTHEVVAAECKWMCKLGAAAALILLVYSGATIVILAWLGGPPLTAQDCFDLLRNHPFTTLLRLDLLTIIFMPVFYFFYAGLFSAVQARNRPLTALAAALAFVGVTLILATPSVLTLLDLSHQYAAATTDARRTLLLAASEAAISTDTWHSTSARIGGVLLQLAGVLISVAMLRTRVFSRLTGYLGVAANGLDLAHILVGLFLPAAGAALMILGGPLYLIWFPLVARRLFQLGQPVKIDAQSRYSS